MEVLDRLVEDHMDRQSEHDDQHSEHSEHEGNPPDHEEGCSLPSYDYYFRVVIFVLMSLSESLTQSLIKLQQQFHSSLLTDSRCGRKRHGVGHDEWIGQRQRGEHQKSCGQCQHPEKCHNCCHGWVRCWSVV